MALSKQGLLITSTYIAYKYKISLRDLIYNKDFLVGSIPFGNTEASDELNEALLWGSAGLLIKHMIEISVPREPGKTVKDAIDKAFETLKNPQNKYRDLCAVVDNHYHFADEANVG